MAGTSVDLAASDESEDIDADGGISVVLTASGLVEDGSFTVFMQGNAPRSELLRRFACSDHAVLLGTASFWEGVDVRGDALSCVLIDKLPFAVPDDPVIRARAEALQLRCLDRSL